MDNFEKVLKKELGNFEKHFIEFKDDMKNEMSNFKTEIKDEMSNFKTEIKDEMSNFKSEIKDEMSNFKSEIKDEMSNFKTEVKDEIRERFFVFEHDYGQKIDGLYDVVVLNKQIADNKIEELEQKVGANDMRIIKNSLDITALNSKKVNSKNLKN